jgi:sulfonate transport system substrate-binding protein
MWRRLLAMLVLVAAPLTVQAAEHLVRIGYQKYGNLILLKTRGTLESRLKALGYDVAWTEFPSGPPLLEAMNAGAIDFGTTGEAPPIFAQAAGAPMAYVGAEPPAPLGEAILVPKTSAIRSVGDLKGKRIALNKGSNVHYLLVRALDAAGIAYSDIEPKFLAPSDARAAFENGSVDAWVIWDPYLAAAQAATGARTLATGENLVRNVQFYLAATKFNQENPKAVDAILAALDELDRWASRNQDVVADQLSASIHLPRPIVATALGRQSYGVRPIDPSISANQQAIADAFFKLGLIPKPIAIADAVRKPGSWVELQPARPQ